MSNIDKVRKAQRDVELVQSALEEVHGGLETVEAIVETAGEVRRGVRGLVKLGLGLAVIGLGVGVGVLIVRRVRRARDQEPTSTELHPD